VVATASARARSRWVACSSRPSEISETSPSIERPEFYTAIGSFAVAGMQVSRAYMHGILRWYPIGNSPERLRSTPSDGPMAPLLNADQ
jgi:hypothetical protein